MFEIRSHGVTPTGKIVYSVDCGWIDYKKVLMKCGHD